MEKAPILLVKAIKAFKIIKILHGFLYILSLSPGFQSYAYEKWLADLSVNSRFSSLVAYGVNNDTGK
jgi:hypothetical protein